MYKLILSDKAHKELRKINDKDYLRISDKILILENEPRPVGSIKLQAKNAYRLRVGNYRILYEIDDENKRVLVYKISDRKDAYM